LKRKSEYKLCNWCLERQYIKKYHLQKIVEDCKICHGIWNQLDKVCNKIIEATKDYQYDSFLIGLTLDHSFYDNEDKFRSRFRIRGKENIKTSVLREIRKKFGNISNKKINLNYPDITINVQIGKKLETIVSVNSRTVVLSGRYKKVKRFQINAKNTYNSDSLEINQHHIEKILKKELLSRFYSDSIVFCPLGKEEPESLVLGNGRPFYVSIKNSKIISFKHDFSIQSKGMIFEIKEKVRALPIFSPVCAKKVKTFVSFQENLKASDLKDLNDSGVRIIEFVNRRSKNLKFIYHMEYKFKTQKKLEFTIICDNGIPVRKFIEGDENISPNLEQILNRKCKCDRFDILDIMNEDDLLN
jgi:tRNA pseudouridine synthase 10